MRNKFLIGGSEEVSRFSGSFGLQKNHVGMLVIEVKNAVIGVESDHVLACDNATVPTIDSTM